MSVLGEKIRYAHLWLPGYIFRKTKLLFEKKLSRGPANIFLCIADHFEPLWKNADFDTGLGRIQQFVDNYAKIADKHKDSNGFLPKYTFFYPAEEYRKEYLNLLSEFCRRGYGEVEIHLHHDNDTEENLRKELVKFKDILAFQHDLLSKDVKTGEIKYGFIHGNWALNNSSQDGRFCGVNDEIRILQETGCYADLTMPSVGDTQTLKVNSIYYAKSRPDKPKAHNWGLDVHSNSSTKKDDLIIIQGPLSLNWRRRKFNVLPTIENGSIDYSNPLTPHRIKLWIDINIHVAGAPGCAFIKIHTHGCQENNQKALFDSQLEFLFSHLEAKYNDIKRFRLHYVTAREMYNIIKALEDNYFHADRISELRSYPLKSLIS